MVWILALIYSHPDPKVRKMACSVMTEMASGDEKVQKFIEKASGLYLTRRVNQEESNELKEAVFGSLFSILKAQDVTIK